MAVFVCRASIIAGAAALLLATSSLAGAQQGGSEPGDGADGETTLPVNPPLPEERPETEGEEDAAPAIIPEDEDAGQNTGEAPPGGEEAPVPDPRPSPPPSDEEPNEEIDGEQGGAPLQDSPESDEGGATGQDATPPEIEKPEPEEPSPPEPEDPADLRACRAALSGLGAQFQRMDPVLPDGIDEDGCGIAAPFNVTEILPGVTLQPASQMRCETALALARWVDEEVLPASEAIGGLGAELGDLTAINHGSTYVCRPRNNVEDARISEHARGNAVDVLSFTFENGETIAVSPKAGDGTPAEVFQKAVGGGACLHFTTVLGPGSDAYHDDHLHLDVIERSSGYRLCQSP